jgi:hypothetical protein
MTIKPLLVHALTYGIMIVLLLLLAAVGSFAFLGIGALVAWLSPLSLFQGVCMAIGSGVAMTLFGLLLTIGAYTRDADRETEDDFEDDEAEEDDDWLDDEEYDREDDDMDGSVIHVPSEQPRVPKIGRNASCPCGSGKKYKKCCGARPADGSDV